MNTKIRTVLTAASLLALSAVTSQAQLLLNSITHTYTNIVGPAGTTGNGAPNANSSIWSPSIANPVFGVTSYFSTTVNGVPPPAGSAVALNPAGFLVTSAPVQLDIWNINQQTTAALGSLFTSYDVTYGFDFAGGIATDLSLTFHVTITQIDTGTTSYTFTPTFASGGFVDDGVNYTYQASVNGASGTLFASQTAANGYAYVSLGVTLVPVPEPSTYALFGVVALMGVVAVRRFRSSKSVAA